jgi:Cu/Ag efflux pump CusA
MTAELVALVLKFRVLVLGVAVIAMGISAYQLPSAPVDALPEFSPPMVQIQTEALGLSAGEVEQLITVPLEQDLLNGVAWLEQIHSESAPGLSSIDLIFEPGTDILKARQAVQERLTQAHALPAVGSGPIMIQPLSSTSRVMMIGLSSKDLSLIDLSVLARWKIMPRLMGVQGVANVAIWGQRDRQLQVQVNPDRLRENGVTLDQVISTAGNALWVSPLTFVEASTPGTGGFIDTSTQRFAIQHVLPISTAKDLASVTIEDTAGRTVRLEQVASVVEDHQPLIGDAVLADGPGLMLVIQKFPEANTREVTLGVEEALAALRPGLSGVQVDTRVYHAQSFIDAALQNLAIWTVGALLLVVMVVVLAFLSWRVALIGLVTLLLSLLAAAYAIYLSGAAFNTMALAGLAVALGVVIGDSMVDVIKIRLRLLDHRIAGDGISAAAVVATASSSVRRPALYASLVLLLASMPMFFVDGVPGAFTKPAVVAFAVALLASMVVTLTVTPALAFVLLRGQPSQPRPIWLQVLAGRAFDLVARRAVVNIRWVYTAVVALVVLGAVAGALQLKSGPALPTPNDRNVLVHWEAAPGTSLTEMDRVTSSATQQLLSIPGIEHVGAHVGRAVTGDQIVNVNAAEIWITLKTSADYEATLDRINQSLRGFSGMRGEVMTYAQDRISAVQSGPDDAVVVRIYGQDYTTLRKKAEEVQQLLTTVEGVANPRIQGQAEEATLEVQVNLQAAQKVGLNPGDVRRAATTFYSGLLVGNLYEEQKVFDVVVQGPPSMRTDPAKVADLMIDTPSGSRVRLGDVASVRITPYPTVIVHDATSRSLDVTAGISGRDLGAVLAEVKSLALTVQMPLEYHLEVLSAPAVQQANNLQIAGLALAAAVGILLLLQAAFASWRLASIVFVSLPLSVVGGVVVAPLVGGLMTFGALAGIFTVLAMAIRNAMFLISAYQQVDSAGIKADLESLLRATREPAGQAGLVAVAVAFAVLPLALMGPLPGVEILHSYAVVVLGGLLTTTFVTLVVWPALYHRFEPAHRGALAFVTEGTELVVAVETLETDVVAHQPAKPGPPGNGESA